MMRALLLSCFVGVQLLAQTTATSPNPMPPGNVNLPFAAGIGRYQQWYAAAPLAAQIPEPMRMNRLEFFAGSSLTSITTTITCEVLMGHGFASNFTGVFANNYSSPPVVVAPLQTITLLAGPQGTTVINIPFTTMFTWDRVRPIVVEVRVHGNGQNNQPFLYNFNGALAATGSTQRVYHGGSVGGTSGSWQGGIGLVTRFTARPGVMLDYGTACVGGGGVAPKNRVVQVMSPGIAWTHELQNAASQEIALWIMGTSDTAWETLPLATDLTALLGYPPSGCMLRTNPLWSGAYITIGGGPGSGFATFTWQLPGVASYVGLSFYTQWVVWDPFSPNGVLTTTQGIRNICAPVGG